VNAGTKVLFPKEFAFDESDRSARHQAPSRRPLAMLGI
jgi:hypothetical protein